MQLQPKLENGKNQVQIDRGSEILAPAFFKHNNSYIATVLIDLGKSRAVTPLLHEMKFWFTLIQILLLQVLDSIWNINNLVSTSKFDCTCFSSELWNVVYFCQTQFDFRYINDNW